jgi:L-aminopeptidase/D-esterase-like protein
MPATARGIAMTLSVLVLIAVAAVATGTGAATHRMAGPAGSGCIQIHEQLKQRTLVKTRICLPDKDWP